MECIGGLFFNDYKLTILVTMIEPPKVEEEEAFKPAQVAHNFSMNK